MLLYLWILEVKFVYSCSQISAFIFYVHLLHFFSIICLKILQKKHRSILAKYVGIDLSAFQKISIKSCIFLLGSIFLKKNYFYL